MKHITESRLMNITEEARVEANLYRGCRQQERVRCQYIIDNIIQHARDCAKIYNNYYKIYYTVKRNFGTNKWPDMYLSYDYEAITPDVKVRETDKYIIVEYSEHRKVRIAKSAIIAYVWDKPQSLEKMLKF